jgi:hypothetical protein
MYYGREVPWYDGLSLWNFVASYGIFFEEGSNNILCNV